MRKKKNILIIVIISALVLITAIIASLYFFTDIFKSNRQMFVSELAQFMSVGEANVNPLQSYFAKKENTPYENDGTFTVNVVPDSELEKVDIPTVEFSGKSNKLQNQAEQNIEIQYSNDVKFPINYRQNGDIYGLQTDYVSKKYVAVENNNLKEFAEKLGVPDTSEIPDKIEFPNMNQFNFTEEEKAQLQKNYEPILQNITDDKIAITKTENGKLYTLTLTVQDLKNIILQFLEILQKDNIILNKINATFSEGNIQEAIENFKENIQDIDAEGEQDNLNITLIEEQGEPNKLAIKVQSNSLLLEKSQTADKLLYRLTITSSEDQSDNDTSSALSGTSNISVISVLAEFTGLGSQQVTEHYSIDLPHTIMTYDFKNTISFVNSVEVEELTDETAMILNEYPEEQISNLVDAIGKRIEKVNSDQMKELGIDENGNPLMYMIPGLGIYNQAQNTIQNSDIKNAAISTFNSTLEKYEGKQRGTTVKVLLSQIESLQESEDIDREIQLRGITKNDDIDSSKEYNISFEYDSDGYINEVNIEEN